MGTESPEISYGTKASLPFFAASSSTRRWSSGWRPAGARKPAATQINWRLNMRALTMRAVVGWEPAVVLRIDR